MRRFSLIVLLGLLALVPLSQRAYGVTTNINCSFSELTNAYAVMGDGDTINIAAGSNVWPIPWIVSGAGKNITINGSGMVLGVNQTSNYYNVPGGHFSLTTDGTPTTFFVQSSGGALSLQTTASNKFTMDGINFILNGGSVNPLFGSGQNYEIARSLSRLHLYNISCTNFFSGALFTIGFAETWAVVDHCYFVSPPTGSSGTTFFNHYGNGHYTWTNSFPVGSSSNNFVENNYLANLPNLVGNGYSDGYRGGQAVMRYNVFDGAHGQPSNHGYDSDITGGRSQEIYNNLYTNWNNGSGSFASARAGVFLVYSNTAYCSNGATLATMGPQLEYTRGASGAAYSAYTYAGTDQTNYMDTNFVSGVPHGYILTNIWWDRFMSNRIGWFHTEFTDTNLTDANWAVSTGGRDSQTNAFLSFGQQPNYYFSSNTTWAFDNVHYGRHIQYGTNLAETIINIVSAINYDLTGCGTRWSQATTNWGLFPNFNYNTSKNQDLWVTSYGTNWFVVHNRMDGTNAPADYIAAFQQGTYTYHAYTNFPAPLFFPSYQWSNIVYVNGTLQPNTVKFTLKDLPPAVYPSNSVPLYTTNLLYTGRDYYDDVDATVSTNYVPYTYPHPFQADEGPQDPFITQNPTNVTVLAGQNATFYVTATGNSTLSYQWIENGLTLAGATSASFTKINVQLGMNGNRYQCIVSDANGNVVSSAGVLTVSGVPGPNIAIGLSLGPRVHIGGQTTINR